MSQRILGIDPGLNITGYSLIDRTAEGPRLLEAGIIRTSEGRKTSDMAQRLRILYDGVCEIVNQYHPTAVAMEQLYAHYEHPRTAILMGHARGVLVLAATLEGIPLQSYSATRVKQVMTGHGRASKEQMQWAILRELRLQTMPEPADVADAIALALCHYYSNGIDTPAPQGQNSIQIVEGPRTKLPLSHGMIDTP
ncbi:MAG: crossover junction endodeoxyribonuclease RuvC [Gemmataceae bacterium]|jgi:crossover junction endodeoxyribonuclease RuvC|nr:crossover junction endodeoxyribonuclease RuvC [Gemmataceae bacterium]